MVSKPSFWVEGEGRFWVRVSKPLFWVQAAVWQGLGNVSGNVGRNCGKFQGEGTSKHHFRFRGWQGLGHCMRLQAIGEKLAWWLGYVFWARLRNRGEGPLSRGTGLCWAGIWAGHGGEHEWLDSAEICSFGCLLNFLASGRPLQTFVLSKRLTTPCTCDNPRNKCRHKICDSPP